MILSKNIFMDIYAGEENFKKIKTYILEQELTFIYKIGGL